MSLAVIAIVGRPNVGKSSLFNALAGERISIVHDSPGVTRDRIYTECEWYGRSFLLTDTGGIEYEEGDDIQEKMRGQAEFAVETSDLVIFLCDAKEGLTRGDREIADYLRRSGRKTLLAVNKIDRPGELPAEMWEFYELGLGEIYGISAGHRLGLGELMEAAIAELPGSGDEDPARERIKIAVVGKPNAGKSSLVNRLLGEERCIVSQVAGTTRDALDTDLDHPLGHFRLIDTAGLRRQSRMEGKLEKYSKLRTLSAIERADVCLILLDAAEGLSEQDSKIAGLVHEAGKASIFVVNKWDLPEKDHKTMDLWRARITDRFPFMRYAPSLFLSALTGSRVDKLLPEVQEIWQEAGKRLGTGVINEVLAEAVAMHSPPQDKGRALKIFYATQVATRPPQFVFFVNDKELMHFSYERYLENRFRDNFGFVGSPLRFIWRDRKKTDVIRVDGDESGRRKKLKSKD